MSNGKPEDGTLFGHPTGLFTLFFAEMWERFSYYGMRALLVFYMIKGFLGFGDSQAYAVYGAYTALVYMTPFFGGMLADRLLGARRAVILGGLLMAGGHLMMTIESAWAFFTALGLLIAGNGFFKPNISTIVGSLYPPMSGKRDGGFTIFYMGINLGAAMSPLLCGYVGETYGWHYGFGLATIGMLIGLAVFVAPTLVTQVLIMAGALAAAFGLFRFHAGDVFSIAVNSFVAISLVASGIVSWVALARGGLDKDAGGPPDPKKLREPIAGIPAEFMVYLGTLLSIPLFALLVSGFGPLRPDKKGITLIPDSVVEGLGGGVLGTIVSAASTPAGLILLLSGIVALGYLVVETFRLDHVRRERMFVVMILTFFSMLFWSFFEQAGSSVNNFTDRNVDRVFEAKKIEDSEVGQTLSLRLSPPSGSATLDDMPMLTQEQLGYTYNSASMKDLIERAVRAEEARKAADGEVDQEEVDELVQLITEEPRLTITALTYLRGHASREDTPEDSKFVEWTVAEDNVGMGLGGSELPASIFQAVNPIYIILLGLVFSTLWSIMASQGIEPSTPVKFSLGLMQLGLGFGAFWYGAASADSTGMVALSWLFIGYLFQTTGELCLSPVGLSMITKLSPARLVSTVMGTWFLATAFSQFLAAIIAQFTGVTHGGSESVIPVPIETVGVYGGVFKLIAMMALGSGVFCLILSPILKKWMHEGVETPKE